MLFLFEFIGLKEVCSFAGVQESDHEGKTKWQSIKIINGKVNTFIKDEDKTELLNEIIGRSKKGSHLNHLAKMQLSTSTMTETSAHLAQMVQAS